MASASKHDRTYVHVRGLTITTSVRVGARGATCLLGRQVMKIKTTKINSEGLFRLFMKFSTPKNYPLYGIIQTRSLFMCITSNLSSFDKFGEYFTVWAEPHSFLNVLPLHFQTTKMILFVWAGVIITASHVL